MATDARRQLSVAAFPDPRDAAHVTYNPTLDELRAYSEHLETTTEYGSPSYVSDFRSRSSAATRDAVTDDFDDTDYAVLTEGLEWVENAENDVVCLDRRVGRNEATSFVCRLFVPREYGRIALAWAKLLEPAELDAGEEPDFVTVQVPDADGPRIRVLPEEGVTSVLGSDYTGEAKKSFLRLFMFRAKQQGGLGLHAGSKRVHLDDEEGERAVGQVFLGLSGTGKSTLTSHGLWLDEGESTEMLQDDVCALLPDGTVTGSEGGGLYIKTIGLEESEQPELYGAATASSAVLENVAVDADGTVHFDEPRHGKNARAIVSRDELDSAGDDIDLDTVDQLFFITRNPLMPAAAKLSNRQAAAAFMLGESIETSAGDPSRAGESIRVVGTNPFIVGSKGEEGNRFRELIAGLGIDCYVINTGSVGTADPANVGVADTVTLLEAIARGTVEWTTDEASGLRIPERVPGLDVSRFDLAGRSTDYAAARDALREERVDYLEQFEMLDEEILDAVY
ncbi:phosphoenolpyruvate carboxykinase (ATP) [Halocalculus aciditolerans]|uniref:phosphoenolpyruvate carboxykinase (ATP) n=1 Tax=Halocalculus aciditolerans TaxID=1383812 RepID=A0A830FNT7_9EURY|nr:phosphoenolpyruvate carboxykinase (ATP) [Halocalculus aciditolerans]GGL65739.1 hypothetical protein GCM10009039_24530 [Halocalculus aciditolerans]